jgi:L-2-hydroxyglutarate oxidase LhgO
MGHAKSLTSVPLKGRYAISKAPYNINMLVYPVPQPGAYVLGVHSTLTTDGYVKIGPTVFPAFGQENYDWAQGVTLTSLTETSIDYLRLLASKKERGLIWHFITKELIKSVSIGKLTRDVNKIQKLSTDFHWYKSGIRPQLYCTEQKKLINDFVCYGGANELHLLNVVSPGWTCAMPFADAIIAERVLN